MINIGEREVRQRVLETINRYGIKQVDIARETGINHSSLSLWLQAKIKGHFVKIEETLEEWLKNIHNNKNNYGSLGQQNRQNQPQYPQQDKNDHSEHLLPISVDIELDGIRYREFFLWNIYEPGLTPESLAKLLSEENHYPNPVEKEIVEQIKRQVMNYKPFPQSSKDEEILRVLDIDVRIDNISLKDRIEWDISDPSNSPELFAYNLAEELSLTLEFAQRISHQIREQILYHQRSIQTQKQSGKIEYTQLKKSTRSLLETYSGFDKKQLNSYVVTPDNYLRPIFNNDETEHLKQWEPRIDILDELEIRKVQKLEDRKSRYKRRI